MASKALIAGRKISSPMRPTSSYTNDSNFADSAVDMDIATEMSTDLHAMPITPLEIDQTLSDKMRQLAAVAFTMEQDDNMPQKRRSRLLNMLSDLEKVLEPEEQPAKSETCSVSGSGSDDEWIDEADLIAVRDSLAQTVKSMRQRHEEQRHLHQLMAQKLEAVAQRCLLQEQQAEDLLRDMRQLRLENHSLTSDNEALKERVACLEIDASRNEVAVEAMSSAVTGLEGWIEAASPAAPALAKSKRQKVVIRGKGRFRGRYYVDEDGDQAVAYSLADAAANAADSDEIHDGVKAWLRGFRDVEEELRHHDPPTPARSAKASRSSHLFDDDWGDFEAPSVPGND